jgi:uncharacterized protein
MIRRTLLLGMGSLLLPARARAQDGPQPVLRKERLVIATGRGQQHAFTVEMALTPTEQSVGLMFRTQVPQDGGMLFDWGRPRISQMWMRNTIVSLDMVFIAQDGLIRTIAERTVPQSLAVIDSRVPVRATLELLGGTCERLDIRVGDRVLHPIFTAESKG